MVCPGFPAPGSIPVEDVPGEQRRHLFHDRAAFSISLVYQGHRIYEYGHTYDQLTGVCTSTGGSGIE